MLGSNFALPRPHGATSRWWASSSELLDGNEPVVYADFGRDRYALANVGPNLVVNGDFSSGLTGWTTDAGVTISGGAAVFSGVAAGVGMYCTLSGIASGDIFSVTYTVASWTSGQVRASLEASRGATRTTVGGFNELIIATQANPRLLIQGVAGSNSFSVTGIVVRKLAASLGPNLLRNGNFDTDLAGWTDASTAPSTTAWSSANGGQALFTSDATNAARLRQQIATIPGRTYVVSSTGTAGLAVGASPGAVDILALASNTSRVFVATGAATHLGFYSNAVGTTSADNVSVREVLVGFGPELVVNGTFDTNLAGWTDASTAPSTFVWSSANGGQAVASADGTNSARIRQSISVVPGRTYVVTSMGTTGMSVGTAAGGVEVLGFASATSRVFTATTSTVWLNTAVAVNGATFDNVSVREILTNQPLQPVTFSELFSLSSSAKTVVANDNTLKTVPANTPAFDYSTGQRRLLLEGAATNICTYSDDITGTTNWVGDGATKSLVNGVSRFTAPAGSRYPRFNFTLAASTTYSLQFEVRSAGSDPQTFRPAAWDGAGWLLGSLVTLTPSWQKVTYTFTSQASIGSSNGVGFQMFSGGSAAVEIRRVQIEVGPGPSSYIATSGSQVSRIADLCAFSPLLNLCLVTQAATMAYRANMKTLVTAQPMIGLSGWSLLRAAGGTPSQVALDAHSVAAYVIGSGLPGEIGATIAWDTSGRAGAVNGAAAVTNPTPPDKQMPPFFLGVYNGMAAGTIHALGAFIAWPLKGTNTSLQQQARAYA